MQTVTRSDLMAVIGPRDHSPSEAVLEELEAELEVLRRERIHGIDDRDLFDSAAARRLVVRWKLRHKLEPKA